MRRVRIGIAHGVYGGGPDQGGGVVNVVTVFRRDGVDRLHGLSHDLGTYAVAREKSYIYLFHRFCFCFCSKASISGRMLTR